MFVGVDHDAPFHWTAFPSVSAAQHMVDDAHETDVGVPVFGLIATGLAHVVPFQVTMPPQPSDTAQNVVVAQETLDRGVPLIGVPPMAVEDDHVAPFQVKTLEPPTA